MSHTKTIAKNASRYRIENIVNSGVALFTSIEIARTLGPSGMGYIIYVQLAALRGQQPRWGRNPGHCPKVRDRIPGKSRPAA